MSHWTCSVVGAREICIDGECFFGDHELSDLCHVHNEEVATLTAERDELQRRLKMIRSVCEDKITMESVPLVRDIIDIAEGRDDE